MRALTVHGRRLTLAAAFMGTLLGAPGGLAVAAQDTTRQVRFTLSVHNPTGATLKDQKLLFYVPRDDGRQELKGLRLTEKHRLTRDDFGNTVASVTFEQLPPFATRVIGITADVLVRSERATDGASNRRFLAPEALIEADDPGIRQLGEQLRRASKLDTAQAIYEWVGANLQYAGYVADDLGALNAFKLRRGDCTEYAYLAAALARAEGIPARVIGGYVTDRDTVLQAPMYHNWAEVFVDGGWAVLDAQKGNWRAHADQYVAFNVLGGTGGGSMGTAHRFRVEGSMVARME